MNLVEQLAAVKAMQVALSAAETQLKSEVMRLSEVTGATTLKAPLGRVNVVTREPKPSIDPAALLGWCREHFPDEIVVSEQVRPTFAKALEAELVVAGDDVINTRTGEVVPFASPSEPSTYVSVTTPSEVKAQATREIGPRLQAVLDAGVLAGRCLSDVTHRDEEHRQSICMLPAEHAPLAHDDCMGCTWTDADHWQQQAVDRVADELQRIADDSQHEGWDHPLVRKIVARLTAALDASADS